MATFLLDTSVIIDALNNKRDRNALLLQFLKGKPYPRLLFHQHRGSLCGHAPEEESATERLLHSLQLLPITWPVAKLAGELKRDYGKKGKTLNISATLLSPPWRCTMI